MHTIIVVTHDAPFEGFVQKTQRPVEFNQSVWSWIYTDTKGSEPVEMIKGKVQVVRVQLS